MKLAVFGTTGQVATELRRRAPKGITVEALSRDRADFAQPEQVHAAAKQLDADAVINAVAYTAVDKAESEPELAGVVNGLSVGALATACAEKSMPLVHISTDYVFPGDGTKPWAPDDETGPLGAYGASKLMGEKAIRAVTGNRHAILRTSWVFSAHGNNFVKTMLRLGADRDQLTIVADQIGGPTPASDIADTCISLAQGLLNGKSGGTYHFSGTPDVSWADFAREIFTRAGISCDVIDIPTSDFPTPAKRPQNSRLDCTSLKTDFGIARPDWRQGLDGVLKDLNG